MLNYLLLLPHIYLLNTTLIFLWYGIYKKHKMQKWNFSEHFGYISIFILLITFILEFFTFYTYIFNNSSFDFNFLSNPLTSIMILFTLLTSILVIIVCIPTERCVKLLELSLETNLLRLLIIFSLITIAISDNLISIFFLLEIYSLSSYILVGKNSKYSVFSGESALKYFFISSVFSILMIFSLASLYSSTGLLNILDLKLFLLTALNWEQQPQIYIASIVLLISIFFKLSAAPFHFWSPDTYEGAPTTVMFFLSVVPKIILFYLILKLNFLFYSLWFILIFSAVLSAYIGSTMGVYQIKFKRLLAYSMISNTGLLLGVLAWSSNIFITSYFFVYLFIYTLTLVGLFGIFLSNKLATNRNIPKNLFSFTNLSEMNPTKFLLLTAIIFTSAGIPPFIGFLIKFLILFSYSLTTSYLFGIVFILLSLTTLTVFYYVRIIKIMSFIKKKFWIFYYTASSSTSYVIVLTFILSIILILFASTIHEFLLLSAII